jgi:hypothetical protein
MTSLTKQKEIQMEILNLLQLAQSKLISQGFATKTTYINESTWCLLSYLHANCHPDELSIEVIDSRDSDCAINLAHAAEKGRENASK